MCFKFARLTHILKIFERKMGSKEKTAACSRLFDPVRSTHIEGAHSYLICNAFQWEIGIFQSDGPSLPYNQILKNYFHF